MPIIKAITDWRPRTPIYYGWVVLGVAAMGTFAATGVAQNTLGGIQGYIFDDTGWDRSAIAFAVTAGTWGSALLTPFVGRLVDRYGPRGLMPIAALVTGIFFLALAATRAVWHFYAAYFIARAIANPNLVGVVPFTVAVNFFRRKRNLAIGLTAMARPVSVAINIQVISLIAQAYGWREAYRFLGVFALVLVVPLFLVLRHRPEDIGLRPDGDAGQPSLGVRRRDTSRSEADPSSSEGEFNWKAGEAALTSAFWFIVIAEMLTILTAGTVSFQVVPYLEDSGLSLSLATVALSLTSLLGALVTPGWGHLADKFPPRRLGLVTLTVAVVVTLLLLVSGSGMAGFFVVVLWGGAAGGLSLLGSAMLAHYFGRTSYGSIAGLMGPFQIGAVGLGPTFGAVLIKATGGFTSLFVYALAAYVLAGVLIYSARAPRLPRRALIGGQPEQE